MRLPLDLQRAGEGFGRLFCLETPCHRATGKRRNHMIVRRVYVKQSIRIVRARKHTPLTRPCKTEDSFMACFVEMTNE
jgi:hypothetical protein